LQPQFPLVGSNLGYLYLYDNDLNELPDWVDQLSQLNWLHLFNNKLRKLPISLINLSNLQMLHLNSNKFVDLPDTIGYLPQLRLLFLSNNKLRTLPEAIGNLSNLIQLFLNRNELNTLPNALGQLNQLQSLDLSYNKLTDLPPILLQLKCFDNISFEGNPLNPELVAAYNEGRDAFKHYLTARSGLQTVLNEAKLILVGEGEVGKTCLMDALLNNPWKTHDSTHGIEIKPIKVTDIDTNTEITLNGWDFGGQRVYRPTHQLFFSAPAVYLVVWKPREGPQQGFVKEWIQLVKRREPSAKILVVATHGGPQQRQPDIDRQELWDLFSRDTVIDFFHVESKPDEKGERRGIEELKRLIARVAVTLPEVGRSVPKSWQDVREALAKTEAAYLPLEDVIELCHAHQMTDKEKLLFIIIEHHLGHFIHYQHDPTLRDIVVLKPDWLATAISFVLDDEVTRKAHGLVRLSRLSQLWDDPTRAADSRYDKTLHPIFLRLMERFDLSYRVADPSPKGDSDPLSLIAQLVPDIRPDNIDVTWPSTPSSGDIQQTQICRIVDAQNGQSAAAEGLFYQLIVRLHKYSLGRLNYNDSIHWQRGLVLDDNYNGRALLEYVGNDVRITVRAPYPERFLAMLTSETKYLVESFWEGLQCQVMVPCVHPCGKNVPGTALFQVEKLIKSKRNNPTYPCPVCDEWQNIDSLLRNAPAAAQPISLGELQVQFETIKDKLDEVNVNTRRVLSQVDQSYTDLLQVLTDEAKEGPRLFSFVPVDRSNFNPKEWIRAKFRLVLWCEHSRLPLPILNGRDSKKGVYELDFDREWFQKAAPYLRFLSGTLGMVLPVASSAVKLALDETAYRAIEEQLDFGKSVIDATIGEMIKIGEFLGAADATTLEHGTAIRAENASLRELHDLLKAKDPGFGGLVRVMNKRQEFLWVHEKFASEY
jgi:GTPase SAR1 family protein